MFRETSETELACFDLAQPARLPFSVAALRSVSWEPNP